MVMEMREYSHGIKRPTVDYFQVVEVIEQPTTTIQYVYEEPDVIFEEVPTYVEVEVPVVERVLERVVEVQVPMSHYATELRRYPTYYTTAQAIYEPVVATSNIRSRNHSHDQTTTLVSHVHATQPMQQVQITQHQVHSNHNHNHNNHNHNHNHNQTQHQRQSYRQVLDLPSIPEQDVQRLEYIGRGTNASVFSCLFDGQYACEKVLTADRPEVQITEATTMSLVDRHPNVLRLFGVCRRSNGEVSLVLELMQCDLLQCLQRLQTEQVDQNTKQQHLLDYLIQIARGLRYLHRNGIVHRDVAARNMLVSGNLVKIADFGLAKDTVGNRYSADLPKPLSTAPEAIRDLDNPDVWTDKTDVWSYGLMIWEVMTFGGDPLHEFHNSVPALMSSLSKGWLPARPSTLTDSSIGAVWRLLKQCLDMNPAARPSLDIIIQTLTMAKMDLQQRQITEVLVVETGTY